MAKHPRTVLTLGPEIRKMVMDLKQWDGLATMNKVIKRAIEEYWKRRAWERSREEE